VQTSRGDGRLGGAGWLGAVAIVLLGIACLSLSIVLLVRAGLGLDPWTVLLQGVARSRGLSLGRATQLTFAGLLVLNYLVGRERPGLATLASVLLEGPLIDFLDARVPAVAPSWPRAVLWLAVGTATMAFGIALYVTPRLGAAPPEGLMFAVGRRLGLSLTRARLTVDGLALAAGFALGGKVGMGTVVLATAVGPLMALCHRRLAWLAPADPGGPEA
jgi:uncharacterized membrane protein YczE